MLTTRGQTALIPYFLDPTHLGPILERFQDRYRQGQPTPHVVIDDFLPAEIPEAVLEEFPSPDSIPWNTYRNAREQKLEASSDLHMGPHTRLLLSQLNSSVFLRFLERLTGINGLVPDPHFNGGGLHQIKRGGFLKVHTDFNRHPHLNLDRRLNLLLYLNKDWREEYGGHFELWDRTMNRCHQRILPIFNRCVVFTTTDYSYHGHPDPLTCPESRTRKSLALYYYTNGRPPEEVSATHSTIFRERPGEHLPIEVVPGWRQTLKRFVPPIVLDLRRAIRRPAAPSR
jgi:hypothetical protein